MEGLAEIQVGTARTVSFRPSAPLDFLQASASGQGKQPSAPYEDHQPSAPNIVMDSSKSVMSLLSMLSLPPSYSDLQRPRSESVFSVETCKKHFIIFFRWLVMFDFFCLLSVPPSYDDL